VTPGWGKSAEESGDRGDARGCEPVYRGVGEANQRRGAIAPLLRWDPRAPLLSQAETFNHTNARGDEYENAQGGLPPFI
jgi:hypothetical protein